MRRCKGCAGRRKKLISALRKVGSRMGFGRRRRSFSRRRSYR